MLVPYRPRLGCVPEHVEAMGCITLRLSYAQR